MTAVGAAGDVVAIPTVRIELLHVPDCPNVDELRRRVEDVVSRLGVSAEIDEIEGLYPSPTLTVNGVDVTGHPVGCEPSCRLDLPTEDQIIAALNRDGMLPTAQRAIPEPDRDPAASSTSLQTGV